MTYHLGHKPGTPSNQNHASQLRNQLRTDYEALEWEAFGYVKPRKVQPKNAISAGPRNHSRSQKSSGQIATTSAIRDEEESHSDVTLEYYDTKK
jgi:hypothetical protein